MRYGKGWEMNLALIISGRPDFGNLHKDEDIGDATKEDVVGLLIMLSRDGIRRKTAMICI